MPSLAQHQSSKTTKLLFIGDSGSGKTGALASLAAAGFKLRIIDVDNGIDILKNYLTHPNSPYYKQNPKAAENVNYVTLTDETRNVNGKILPAKATVWQRAISLLHDWVDGDIKLGKITTWGPDDVLVIDSLTNLSTAAHNFHLQMNGWLGATRTQNEGRRDVGVTQNLLRTLLEMLYDMNVRCNVIVNSHITFVTETGGAPKEGEAASPAQGYPSAIGRALSPHIPRYFNTVLIARTIGAGSAARHKIYTSGQNIGGQVINAKNTAPMLVAGDYPLETGLADYFKAVRG